MKRFLPLILTAFVLSMFAVADQRTPVDATVCSVAHVFASGEKLTAANLNANPNGFIVCLSSIDNANVGSAGFYASQIKPTSTGQATFGGSVLYTFPAGVAAGGPVSGTSGTFTGQVAVTPASQSTSAVAVQSFNATGDSTNVVTVQDHLGAYNITMAPNGYGTFHAGVEGGLLKVVSGASNVTVTTGTGAPTATATSGSIYVRTDGSVGARIYVNQSGSTVWTAIAGV